MSVEYGCTECGAWLPCSSGPGVCPQCEARKQTALANWIELLRGKDLSMDEQRRLADRLEERFG